MANLPLDHNDFVIAPHVAVVDEYRMTTADGSFITEVNATWLQKLCDHMNERESSTGDLTVFIVGHTSDEDEGGKNEASAPQVVGFIRNWVVDDFGNTGRKASFADFWFYKTVRLVVDGVEMQLTAKEVNQKWPRRSAELWPDRYEAEPVSLLGPTTPARDLGLIRLSRGGSLTYFSPGAITMPDDTKKPEAKDDDILNKIGNLPIFQKLAAALDQLTAAMPKPVAEAKPGDTAPPEQPGAPGGAEGAGDTMSDEELDKYLAELEGEGGGDENDPSKSRKESEPPVKNFGGPGGTNTHVDNPVKVKLARLETSNAELQSKLTAMDVKAKLSDIRNKRGLDVNPEDEALIADLVAQPPDMRSRSLDRIVKNSRHLPTDSFHLDAALINATDGDQKRIPSREESQRITKLAREKGISYESAARDAGYKVGN